MVNIYICLAVLQHFQLTDFDLAGAKVIIKDCEEFDSPEVDLAVLDLDQQYGPPTYISRCNVLQILLHTDMVPTGRGFSIAYKEGRCKCLVSVFALTL